AEFGKPGAIGAGCYHMIAPASKQSAHPLEHKWVVINDDDQLAMGYISQCRGGGRRFADFGSRGNHGHRNPKAGSLPQYRPQIDLMIKQPAQPVDNGKPETKAGASVAVRFAEAIELAEDVLLLILRNPSSSIPNLDEQAVSSLAAADDHA